jgi:hypothetical protein
MALVELVHPQGSHQVSVVPLIMKCELFKNNPGLTIAPYRVKSQVSLEDFRDFVSALEDKVIKIKDRNFPGLSQLSEEFGFQALSMKLSAHRRSPGLSDAQTAEVQLWLSGLEQPAGQHERQIAALQSELFTTFGRVETDLARLASELEAVRAAKNSDTVRPAVSPPPSAPVKPPPTAAPTVTALPAARLDSQIIQEFPALFEEFRTKRWALLWRGSRDSFGAAEFHLRCDGRANTLTIIQDTDGNVFGGFTPVEWESLMWNGKSGGENNRLKGDDSLRSFLFTLRNPHYIAARKFALRAENKHRAICCECERGPVFGDYCIYVDGDSGETRCGTLYSYSNDCAYANDTDVTDVFTRWGSFTVKEIEVFEIAD